MDLKALAGKPLCAVIDEICSGVTPRWKTGGFCFNIFDRQTIIGPGHRGILILRTYETAEDRQHTVDYNAIMAALEPLILAIKEGELVVLAMRLPDDGSEPKPILLGYWKRKWKIDVSESPETFTVVDASGASTVFELGTVELPRLSGQALAAEPGANAAVSVFKEVSERKIRRSKYSSYVPDVSAIMNGEHPPMVTEACRRVLRKHVPPGEVEAGIKSLRDLYKDSLVTGVHLKEVKRKFRKNAEIP